MTVEADREYITALFDRLERIEKVADSLGSHDQRREELLQVVRESLASCPAVPPVIASEVLGLSPPTVREWIHEGVLDAVPAAVGGPARTLVEPRRLHDVWHIVRRLRDAGQTRGLLDAVWHRLADHDLLARPDLAESLGQMRRGEGSDLDPHALRASVLRGDG